MERSQRAFTLMHFYLFQDIRLSPPRWILHSAEQLALYSRLTKTENLMLHTGRSATTVFASCSRGLTNSGRSANQRQ